jgi:hypothetical protein
MDEVISEDPLDRQLREAIQYIDDEGFTAQVLQRLPPPQRRRDCLRAVILIGVTLLASVLGFILSDNGRFITVAMERAATLPILELFALALTSGILVTALGLLAVIAKSHEPYS